MEDQALRGAREIQQQHRRRGIADQSQRRAEHKSSHIKRRRRSPKRSFLVAAILSGSLPAAFAQSCVSLSGSTQCSAFNASSISTDDTLTGLFPFLSNVTDTASFDSQIQSYIAGAFVQQRYQENIGCSAVTLSNTTDYYAQYTTSVLCNAIVQNSISPCSLSGSATIPLCAEACAQYAESEMGIADSSLCGTQGPNAMSQIRADFTNCALPADSLSDTCITGAANEPDNCGFSTNLGGLCSYCAASSPNATDSCCVFSDTTTRCTGVSLVVQATSMSMTFTTTATATPAASTNTSVSNSKGLSGGAIAGIVIGSVLGAFILLALLILGCVFLRRRKQAQHQESPLRSPVQSRAGPPMSMSHDGAAPPPDVVQALPGGRVARMAAIEREQASDPSMLGYAGMTRKYDTSSEDDTPYSRHRVGERGGSRAGPGSALGFSNGDSPGDQFSSPEGTSQSEQLNYFKDYYSQDEIHRGDLVSTLWAYQPRANDEFELERGDMLKIVGIWDDGWATGVRVRLRAEDWRGRGKMQRDSGMSNGSSGQSSPELDGDVKAFPLVCVCLPQYWHATIEGESTEEGGTTFGSPGSPSSP